MFSPESETIVENDLHIIEVGPITPFLECFNDLNYKSLPLRLFSQLQRNQRQKEVADNESFCVNFILKQTAHNIINKLFFITDILLETERNRIKLRKILHNLPISPELLSYLASSTKLR